MLDKKLFNQPLTSWMNGVGPEGDIVLSSRVRLARNLCKVPFPNRASVTQLAEVKNSIAALLTDFAAVTGGEYQCIELDKLTVLERNVLIEKHLSSRNHVLNPEHRALVISEDQRVSIMVNEEDHLRIQCMELGLGTVSALQKALAIDDAVEAKLDIAFNEKTGYLTSCPTNLGTGMRASVMVHLPGLVFTRHIGKIINASTQLGFAVRGLYGEGTEVVGNIFQISNQLTLGFSEQEIVENLTSAVLEIVTHERAARKALLAQSPDVVEDKVWRSLGILKYARSITGREALALLSEVKMGIDMGIISAVVPTVFAELLVASCANYLQNSINNGNLAKREIDKCRADIIRKTLGRSAEA